jgi:hypothetical protein
MRCTMFSAYEMSAGTFLGRLSVTTERWVDLIELAMMDADWWVVVGRLSFVASILM